MAIRNLSKKRAAQNRLYKKVRAEFLQENYLCQAGLPGCQGNATMVHHIAGRIGDKLTDTKKFLAVCHPCHETIEHEPVMAKQKGLSKSRLAI